MWEVGGLVDHLVFFLLMILCLSFCFALGPEEDADSSLNNSVVAPEPSSFQITLKFSFKNIYDKTRDGQDAFFGLNNTENALVYGLFPVNSGLIDLTVNKGTYSLWFEGSLFDQCLNSSSDGDNCFDKNLMTIAVEYLDDRFKIYNGPIQWSVPLDVDFFISPFEEGIQTAKFISPENFSAQYLAYHYDDSSLDTISSFPKAIPYHSILRYEFILTSSFQYEGLEVRFRSGTSVRMTLNDISVYDDPWNRQVDNKSWSRLFLPGSFLIEGRNVLSLRVMKDGSYPADFSCKARLLRSMFFYDRLDKPSMDVGMQLFEADQLQPYSFSGTKTINYSFGDATTETLTQFCVIAQTLASFPPQFQLNGKNANQVLASFVAANYSSVVDRSDTMRVFCYDLAEPVIGSSFSWTFLDNESESYEIQGLMHNGQRIHYHDEDRYPVTTFDRVASRTCVAPTSTASVILFSLLTTAFQRASDVAGVTLDASSGELCVDIGASESVERTIGVFGPRGYAFVPIHVLRSPRDCVINSTTLVHDTEFVDGGECGALFTGRQRWVCENGTMEMSRSECVHLPPFPFAYAVSPFYYIAESLSLSPNVTNIADAYMIEPSLPSGLSLDALTGVITGSPTGPNGTYSLTVTATNEGGSVSTTFSLTLLYHPCSYNGESIPSGERVYTRDCNGSSGRVYRVCNDGVLGTEHVDECIAPSSFVYRISSFLAQSRTLALTPVFSNANVGVHFSIAPSLPSGLELNASTGSITGSPSDASGNYSLTITATNDRGNTSTTFSLIRSAALVEPDTVMSLVIYDCPAGYAGSRLHASAEWNSDLTGDCSFVFVDSFLYPVEPAYTVFVPMRVELNHAEVFDEFSIDPALPEGVTFDNTTGRIEGVWSEPDNRTFTVEAVNSIDVQSVTLSLSFKYPPCKGVHGEDVEFGGEQVVKCFSWSFLGSKTQKCVVGKNEVVLEDTPNSCVGLHAGVFGAVLIVCVVIIIVSMKIVSLHAKVKVTVGEVYVLHVCSFHALLTSFAPWRHDAQ